MPRISKDGTNVRSHCDFRDGTLQHDSNLIDLVAFGERLANESSKIHEIFFCFVEHRNGFECAFYYRSARAKIQSVFWLHRRDTDNDGIRVFQCSSMIEAHL